jgi:hypothetical protein
MNTHPQLNTPTRRSLSEMLAQAQADAVKWNQIAADPDLSLPAALFARNMARSSQAAVTLGEMALAYQGQSRPAEQFVFRSHQISSRNFKTICLLAICSRTWVS